MRSRLQSTSITGSMAADEKKHKTLWYVLFAAYLILLFYFLFFSESLHRTEIKDGYRYNLTLFREIRRFVEYRKALGAKAVFLNLMGNVLAFVPFGFCWPLLHKNRPNWLATTVTVLSFSFLVETVQLVFKLGSFDVDDILLNTVGGILGYLLLQGWLAKMKDSFRRKPGEK